MKAITITQPWASAIALGIKHVETRSWRTPYRGPLLIHAAKGFPPYAREFAEVERALGRVSARVPLGAVVAVARLADVRPTEDVALEVPPLERLYGDYTPGRWAWMLDDVRPLGEPIPCKGALGLWTPDDELCRAVAVRSAPVPVCAVCGHPKDASREAERRVGA